MALKITKTPKKPTAQVSKELKESGKLIAEEHSQETPEIGHTSGKVAGTPWCEVGFEASYTHNLGNYQSARVGVSLVIPCQHDEIDEVFEVGKKWVNDRLETLVGELSSD